MNKLINLKISLLVNPLFIANVLELLMFKYFQKKDFSAKREKIVSCSTTLSSIFQHPKNREIWHSDVLERKGFTAERVLSLSGCF